MDGTSLFVPGPFYFNTITFKGGVVLVGFILRNCEIMDGTSLFVPGPFYLNTINHVFPFDMTVMVCCYTMNKYIWRYCCAILQ